MEAFTLPLLAKELKAHELEAREEHGAQTFCFAF
jgi:hypothetical protein